MRIKTLITAIILIGSVMLLVGAVVIIPKMQYPTLQFNHVNTNKFTDYYLDPSKVSVNVYVDSDIVEIVVGGQKFVLIGESNLEMINTLPASWNKSYEDSRMYSMVPPSTCTSLLLRFKYLDYSKLEIINCVTMQVQYTELR